MRESRKPPSFRKERSPESSDILRAFIILLCLLWPCPGYVILAVFFMTCPGSVILAVSIRPCPGYVILAVYLWSYPNMVLGNAQILDIILPLLRYIADYCIGQLCLLTRGGHVLL